MSGPRNVVRVRLRGDELVRVLECGCEQMLPAKFVPKAWRTPKGDIDLRFVLKSAATCTTPGCRGEPPKAA